jgi:acetate kinase
MGMTPLEGLMMGTRAGSIDPGIILRRLRQGAPLDEVEADLEHRSGLVAVGGTADMVRLLAAEASGEPAATLAIEMFVRRAAAGIAGAATTVPTLDALVFTGGIGQHATALTERIRARLHLPGKVVEAPRSDEGDAVTPVRGGPAILRIAAREDLVIAEAVFAVLGMRSPR